MTILQTHWLQLEKIGLIFEKYFEKNNEISSYQNKNRIKVNIYNKKYPLAKIVAEILVHTEFNLPTRNKFCYLIKKYNKKTGLNLKYKLFLEKSIISEINGLICLGRGLKYSIYYKWDSLQICEEDLPYYELLRENKDFFYGEFYLNARISKNSFQKTLVNYPLFSRYLKKYFIKELDEDRNYYVWENIHGLKQNLSVISDEIYYHLWCLLKDRKHQFIHIIQSSFLYFKPFSSFFYKQVEIDEYRNFLRKFLNKEQDIVTSHNECKKIIYTNNDILITEHDKFKLPRIFFPSLFVCEKEKGYFNYLITDSLDFQWNRYIFNSLISNLSFDNRQDQEFLFSLVTQKHSLYLAMASIESIKKRCIKIFPKLIFISPVLCLYVFMNVLHQEIDDSSLLTLSDDFDSLTEQKQDIKLECFQLLFKVLAENAIKESDLANIYTNIFKPYQSIKYFQLSISMVKVLAYLYRKTYSFSNKNGHLHQNLKATCVFVISFIKEKLLIGQNTERYILYLIEIIKIELSYKAHEKHHAFIQANIALLHLLLDMNELTCNKTIEQKITSNIADELICFFTSEQLRHTDGFNLLSFKVTDVTYSDLTYGFESIDWANIYILLFQNNLYEKTYYKIISSIVIDNHSNKFSAQNQKQRHRLIYIFKSLSIAYLALNKQGDFAELIRVLHEEIKRLSIEYNLDFPGGNKINIFEYDYLLSKQQNDPYYQDIRRLFCQYLDTLIANNKNETFIRNFVSSSNDINFLIEMLNYLHSVKLKSIIQERLDTISIDDFLNDVFMITELEQTVLNAVNSESHFNIAKQLLPKVKSHYQKRNYLKKEVELFCSKIELLIALKEGNIEFIDKIRKHENSEVRFVAAYYHAIYPSYHGQNWDESLKRLEGSLFKENNIEYDFQEFRCTVLSSNKNDSEKVAVFRKISNKIKKMSEEQFKVFTSFYDYFQLLKLIPLKILNENLEFLIIYNGLNDKLKYSDEILKVIFDFFYEQQMYIEAKNYLIHAQKFYQKNNMTIPKIFYVLEENFNYDLGFYKDVKSALSFLSEIHHKELIKLLPNSNVGNYPQKFEYFLLSKIINYLKLLVEKKSAIKHENEYSDLLVALLKSNLSCLGWSIEDQTRSGISSTKKDAGEIDISISHRNNRIAAIEALRLKTQNNALITQHILKTISYSPNLCVHYILVYFIGEKKQFEHVWNGYKNTVMNCDFGDTYKRISEINDIEHLFDNIARFKVAETKHENNVQYFHIMVDFSL